jgi:hypothetical protein
MKRLECYNNNKRVMYVEIAMSEEKLVKQIKEGVLTYLNPNTGVEIVNLRKFDKVVIVGDNDWVKYV